MLHPRQGHQDPAAHCQGPGYCSAGQFAPVRAEGKDFELCHPLPNTGGNMSRGCLGDVQGGGGKCETYGGVRAGGRVLL